MVVSLNSRLENNKEEEKRWRVSGTSAKKGDWSLAVSWPSSGECAIRSSLSWSSLSRRSLSLKLSDTKGVLP